MKKVLFSAFLMVFVFVGGVYAFPTSPAFPEYTDAAQSNKATTAAGTLGTVAAGTIKSSTINVATTKYVNTQAETLEAPINSLASAATSDNTTVTANGTAITALNSGRIDAPTSANKCPSTCGTNGTSACECGYISADGTNGTKQWVVIQK